MGDLFGGSGPSGEAWRGPDAEQDQQEEVWPTQFVEFDNVTGEMIVTLPPRFAKYQRELYEAIMEEFYLESMDNRASTTVNEFISNWLRAKVDEEAF